MPSKGPTAGAWAREAPRRHYAPADLGGLCKECHLPIPAALAGIMDMHPTCDPDWPPMLAAAKRRDRRKATQ